MDDAIRKREQERVLAFYGVLLDLCRQYPLPPHIAKARKFHLCLEMCEIGSSAEQAAFIAHDSEGMPKDVVMAAYALIFL